MPIAHSCQDGFGDSHQEEILKHQLLDRIASAASTLQKQTEKEDTVSLSDVEDFSDEGSTSEKLVEAERRHCITVYESLVEKTRDIPLEKVVFSAEGCAVFDELCLRIDVNQRYASVLPQWKDVAHLLEVDTLRTKWVETCVRPREGLTRAMLEMYMQDGGTLGDVLQALLQLECMDILESVRPRVETFLDERSRRNNANLTNSPESQVNEKFFSVIKTLIVALGQADPCLDLQKYANGLKPVLKNRFDAISSEQNPTEVSKNSCLVSRPMEHQILIQNGSTSSPNYSSPSTIIDRGHLYNPKIHMDQLRDDNIMDNDCKKLQDGKEVFDECSDELKCRILVLFSEDGIEAASEAVAMAKTVKHEEVKLDMFRLNEVSLWYEVLTNPEACCLKWVYEADYIIPVLTPKFLQEIHGDGVVNDDGLLPTSPLLNRYMYTLARTQYTQASCKNLKVRPVIPQDVLREIRTSNAVKIDPLLNSSWVALNQERFVTRIKGLLNEYLRKSKRQAAT